jgi:putative SOS response-associated peptidase YedK
MPAILLPSDWKDWLEGPPDAAGLLCRPFEAAMTVDCTAERWAGGEQVCTSFGSRL